jgi:predicted amidohydrolase
MRLSLCQLDIVWNDKTSNLIKCDSFAAQATANKSDVIIFPEMSLTGFSLDNARQAEAADGESIKAMQGIAEQHDIIIVFGLATKQHGKKYNTLVVLNRRGKIIHTYNKIHPFSHSKEHRIFSSGASLKPFKLEGQPCCGVICYDLRFPELFTSQAKKIVLYIVIANWPESRREHWNALLKARALDTLSFVAGVNRTGTGGKLHYAGDSQIVDPWGNVCASFPDNNEGLLTYDIDFRMVREVRSGFSLLADRRNELYRQLLK